MQLALYGMGEDQVKEAGWVAQTVTGTSSYLYGIGYDQDRFRKDLDAVVAHAEKSAQE